MTRMSLVFLMRRVPQSAAECCGVRRGAARHILIFLVLAGAFFLAGCSGVKVRPPDPPHAPDTANAGECLDWATDPLGDPKWPILGRVSWFFGPGH